jgi:hypothetical protein
MARAEHAQPGYCWEGPCGWDEARRRCIAQPCFRTKRNPAAFAARGASDRDPQGGLQIFDVVDSHDVPRRQRQRQVLHSPRAINAGALSLVLGEADR